MDEQGATVSNESAQALLDLLVKRGYFHENAEPILADHLKGKPSASSEDDDDNHNKIEALEGPLFSLDDSACRVVFLKSNDAGSDAPCCCTYPVLEEKLNNELHKSGGRAETKQLVTTLRLLDEKPLLRILERNAKSPSAPFQIGDDVVNSSFLDRVSKDVFDSLRLVQEEESEHVTPSTGLALISDLAHQDFHLPMDITFQAIKDRIPTEGFQLLDLEAGAAVASDTYMERYKAGVMTEFAALQEPVVVSDLCRTHSWDVGLVTAWVQEACNNNNLPGDFHGESNVTIGSLYTPKAHLQAQRVAIDELFDAQGYITASKGAALGLSKSKMGDYIKESFPSAIVISETLVVSYDTVLGKLEGLFQEAIAVESFVDLQNHLPLEILENEEDTRSILEQHVIPSLAKGDDEESSKSKKAKKKRKQSTPSSPGVVVLSPKGCLFVSAGMIQHIEQKSLPDLIAKHAKSRAETIDAANASGESSANQAKPSSKKKGGRKGKKGAKATQEESNTTEAFEDLVPLVEIIQSFEASYPDLLEVDALLKEAVKDKHNDALPHLVWEDSHDVSGDVDESLNDSVVCELCRSCLYTDSFVSSCHQATQVELKRLESARMSKASVSRKEAATNVRNVESAFEESFVNACYMLQSYAKFLQYVESLELPGDGESIDKPLLVKKLTSELLEGCCADFTSRLTQYCLFKNEIDPGMFHFVRNSSASDGDVANGSQSPNPNDDGGLPPYCAPVDLAVRQYPKLFLSLGAAAEGSDSNKSKDPLPRLREVLPGSLGVSLARQWVACGGNCYQGGSKVDDEGNDFTRPGDLEKFMEYVEENCLSLCGLPFRKLDKKAEKQFLFARRQQLLHVLEEAPSDAACLVLDLTIMLLFQQAKNVVSFGCDPLLRLDLARVLSLERKINQDVSELLMSLATSIQEEIAVDSELVATVRACGMSRDISKHQLK